MDKTLDLVSLDDDELLEVTGGGDRGGCGQSYCQPHCQPQCEPSCGFELDACVKICW